MDIFQLWFLYKSDSRISTAVEKMKELSGLNTFQSRKTTLIFQIIDVMKGW